MIEQNQALHTLLGVEIPSIGVYVLVRLVAFCTALMGFFSIMLAFEVSLGYAMATMGMLIRHRCCLVSVCGRVVIMLRGNRR